LPHGTPILPETASVTTEGIGALLRPPFRRDTLSLWSAFCFCLISIYFVFNWLPSMLTTLGMGPAASSNGLAIYNFGGIIGSLLLGVWINRQGSKVPLRFACAGSILSAVWLASHLVTPGGGTPLLTFQLGVHGFFTNAVQTSLYALSAHLYPTRLRARGVASASAFGRAGAMLSAFLGGRALLGTGSAYFLILVVTLSGVALSLQFLRNHIPGSHGRAI
jgi:AAHS family 4-hydroxybenzoate transporter-like MFS transporter